MVVGGDSSLGTSNYVEIVDIESTRTNCPSLPSLPIRSYQLLGTFGYNESAIVCGGYYGGYGFYR
jgi:hypothetical protein